MPEKSKSYKAAKKLDSLTKAGKKISKNQLYNAVVSTENLIADRLTQLGESNNVSKVAKAVVKKLSGVELSVNEIEALSKSSYGQEDLNTIVPKVEDTNAPVTENLLQGDADSGIINNNQETGVGMNDGQQDGNDSQWSGGRIFSSKNQTGTIQETDGEVYENSSGKNRGTQSTLRNQRNNRRIEPTSEQKKGLKTTAIKDENGNPKEVSHFTDNMDFETFAKGDIGFHFGSESQAQQHKENLKRQNKLNSEGRIIKAHLDIKNPIYVSSDIMCWWPAHTALRLYADGIIDFDQYLSIYNLQVKSGHDYDLPAAVKLRKMLGDLGYDGIVYQNNDFFEGEGESYIAFYPEQVIIVDDGKINNEADPEGPANFMPEGENSSLNEGADESGKLGLTEPTDQEIYRDPTDEENTEAIFGKRKNAKQRHILDVAKKLDSGMKVVFVAEDAEVFSGQKGVYMRGSNTIYLSESNPAVESYYQVFKHEFIHRLESKGAYQSFKNYLFRHSTAFERYARAQLGQDFKGTREEALQALAQKYVDNVQEGTFSQEFKKSFTAENAQYEMVADFISEVLFKGNRADVAQHLADSNLEAIFNIDYALSEFEALSETDRTWFQKIIDTIKDFIASLTGVKQNERLITDLKYIESRLARVLDSRDTKKAASRAGNVQFSFNDTNNSESKFIIDTINDNINLISEKSVFSVEGEQVPEGTKKTEYVLNIFNEQGNVAHNKEIGSVELVQSGAKSTVFHGFGAEKLAATRAIKSVIEQGSIIKTTKNYNNTGVDRYVMATKGNIDGKPAFVGLIIKAYPNQKNQNAKFYLHEATIIETDSPIMTVPQLSVDTVSESVYKNSLPHQADTVNNNSMQEAQDYTESPKKPEGQFSLGSPYQKMLENRKRYENGEITQEKYLEETERLWGEANQEYGVFEEGEKANAPFSTPKAVAENKPVERFTRTILETGKLTDEMLEGIEEKVLLGDFDFICLY